MRELLARYFGERSNNALIVHADGKDWVSSRSLCDLMGTRHEYHLVEDMYRWPEMNLNHDDKCKLSVEGAHRCCPIWFVSETGFWKIVARSHSLSAEKIRATFLPVQFPQAD